MTMKDWIKRLDDFIRIDGSKLLENAGRVTQLEASTKAQLEFEKFKAKTKDELSNAELDFLESLRSTQKMLKDK
jgi:hypothetical protein